MMTHGQHDDHVSPFGGGHEKDDDQRTSKVKPTTMVTTKMYQISDIALLFTEIAKILVANRNLLFLHGQQKTVDVFLNMLLKISSQMYLIHQDEGVTIHGMDDIYKKYCLNFLAFCLWKALDTLWPE
ncbi:hypothetical protein Scep_015145 [Stephania cephalantha]|uniref:Uncharacterized protein n=1 Tax=Stephania cephalantha TaxID=152367 RepID=A0AAP0J2M6_9MAGN